MDRGLRGHGELAALAGGQHLDVLDAPRLVDTGEPGGRLRDFGHVLGRVLGALAVFPQDRVQLRAILPPVSHDEIRPGKARRSAPVIAERPSRRARSCPARNGETGALEYL